ncbi:TetR/AcrR family transcriptional regulator C-terminal domain-containing protein [Tumebacillus flagellatus]|uniref:TetR family transcriptional regulator n=1 Tax=Tumebacillus flagellatus TaxID=1157490 RepID=A0A074LT68_9BACL|nr:TetR/AcrR family transcriptional regulator C-terminal domain-containing protein [Tumebacillus flagellatus]KEO83063.1 TetR family transcriptional regulator [Tumebacillus flagellatus]
MMNTNRTVVSRRSRPAKEPLSHELIVQTAYRLLKDEGMSGMSMRKVAKALDTGPSSLYVYVKNLQELSAFVLDHGMGELRYPDGAGVPWQERLFDVLTAYLHLLFEHPGLAELALTTLPMGEHSLRLTETILSALAEGGIRTTAAAWGVDLILFYVSSVAFEHVSWKKQGTDQLASIKASYQSADPARYPQITALGETLFSGDTSTQDRFRWGLQVILQGILQTQNEKGAEHHERQNGS